MYYGKLNWVVLGMLTMNYKAIILFSLNYDCLMLISYATTGNYIEFSTTFIPRSAPLRSSLYVFCFVDGELGWIGFLLVSSLQPKYILATLCSPLTSFRIVGLHYALLRSLRSLRYAPFCLKRSSKLRQLLQYIWTNLFNGNKYFGID